MKKAIFIFIMMLTGSIGFSQNDPENTSNFYNTDNISPVNFLKPTLHSAWFLSLETKSKWNAQIFNDAYNQLLSINKKKQFYPILLIDNRYVSHATASRYSSQNYMWVSTQSSHKTFAGGIAGDIITSFINSKTTKHGFNFKPAEKGYHTPIGIKY